MKKILLILLLLFVVSGCKKSGNNLDTDMSFTYNLLDDDTYEILGSTDSAVKASTEKVEIPSKYKDKEISTIAHKAFSGYSALKNISIPESLKYINAEAFWDCSSLVSIELPVALEWIFVDVFYGCSALESISISEDNPAFSSSAGILYNKLKTSLICCPEAKQGVIFVPETVELIDVNAFVGCHKITEINIGPAVYLIVVNDFWGCWECRGVSLVGDHAFWQASGLLNINVDPGNENYRSIEGVLYSKDAKELIVCPAGKTETIIIPESVESVGMGAFSSCAKVETIIFPQTLMNIAPNAFWGCDSLSEIIVHSENEVLLYEDGVIYGEGGAKLIVCFEDKVGEFVIPDRVTYIASYAFFKKNKLTSVVVPSSVLEVEDYAFTVCENLTIKVAHETRLAAWYEGWNPDEIAVVWGYKG